MDEFLAEAIDSVTSMFDQQNPLFAELKNYINSVINTLKSNPKNIEQVLNDFYLFLNKADSNNVPYIK
jgi:hypothetical protein